MKNTLAACILFFVPIILISQGPVAETRNGKITGSQTDSGIKVFKGIPFAAPPVGPLRWQPPQPVTPWEGVKACVAFGPSPVQAKPAPFAFWSSEFLIPEAPISEDCLYLNVWTKVASPSTKMPVLVYIYGGGFRSGGSACPIYDGSAMAEKDVVFVSINYRVGVFGFLAHPALTATSPSHTSGNYALLDMIAALEWVRDNIAAFGGDPANVTIAGQSAGAFAVNYLTVCPRAEGLFHKAIAESGGSFYTSPTRPLAGLKAAEQEGVAFAKGLGAETIETLRKKPAAEILAGKGGSSGPIIDGIVIPESIFKAYANGKQADVPLLLGWNADDLVFLSKQSAEAYAAHLKDKFGEKAPAFLQAYPAGSDEEAIRSQHNMSRDEFFAIQAYTWARMQDDTGTAPVYLYNFNRRLPAYDPATDFGAFHSGEIVYAYDNLATLDRPWEEVDHRIASTMSGYWVNFVKTGNPNDRRLPVWKPFNNAQPAVLLIDADIKSASLPDAAQLSVWDAYYQPLQNK